MKPCKAQTLLIHVLSGAPPCEKLAIFVATCPGQAGVELCSDHAVKLRLVVPSVTLKPIGSQGPN